MSSHVTHATKGLYGEGDESDANGLAGSAVGKKLSLLGTVHGPGVLNQHAFLRNN